jgi:hypothetical protein
MLAPVSKKPLDSKEARLAEALKLNIARRKAAAKTSAKVANSGDDASALPPKPAHRIREEGT